MQVEFKVHVRHLFDEILSNPGNAVMAQPLRITMGLLQRVAARAIELNDPELHRLMIRLTLYAQADPTSPDYDPEMLKELEPLCDDEGCPHHGTPHVCVQRDHLADRIEAAELAPGEQWKDD